MDAGLLNTVTCYYNPIRWEARLRTCKEHLEHLLDTGTKPLLVECQTGDRSFQFADFPHIRHVGVRSKTLLWNKESLLRIGMQRLDPDWEYVCWTDADIKFRKSDWAYETVHALQIYDVLQPWSDAYDLGPGDAHLAVYKSFMHQFWHGQSCVYGVPPEKTAFERRVAGLPAAPVSDPVQVERPKQVALALNNLRKHHPHGPKHHPHVPHDPNDPNCPCCSPCYCPPCPPCPPPYYGMVGPAEAAKMPWWKRDGGPHEYPHTGYAWAATRRSIEALGGLFEVAAMGAGDYHMALALIGYADRSIPGKVNPSYRKHLMEWQERALRDINFNLGYIPGTIEHSWHGRKADRRYIDRWQIILEHDFDPDTDIMKNSHGVIELTCRKPKLRHDLDVYLRQRQEDANVL